MIIRLNGRNVHVAAQIELNPEQVLKHIQLLQAAGLIQACIPEDLTYEDEQLLKDPENQHLLASVAKIRKDDFDRKTIRKQMLALRKRTS